MQRGYRVVFQDRRPIALANQTPTDWFTSDFNRTMEKRMSEGRGLGQVELRYSIDAFFAGLLFFLAILLTLFDQPSDFVGMLTDLVVHFSWNSRALGLPIAAIMLAFAIWRSWRIYRARVITRTMQFGLGLFACALVLLKIFLFTIGLRAAIIGGIMSM
jgi:hypothetical protein